MCCRWIPGLPKRVAGTDSMVRFAMNTYGRFTLNYAARNMDNLLVGWRFGSQALGFYKKAYDLLIQSESGFLSVTGTPAEPCKAGISVADISAGMYAYSGILAALLQRGRTGLGSHLDVSLFETSVEWMSFPLYYAYQGAPAPPRTGAAHATIYPYGPFRTGGGGQVKRARASFRARFSQVRESCPDAALARSRPGATVFHTQVHSQTFTESLCCSSPSPS